MPFQMSPRPEVVFRDRAAAGVALAQAVLQEAQTQVGYSRFVVYALPRGGLPVAAPIAQALHCPLDVIVAKKITRPEHPELAIGAVTAEGHLIAPQMDAALWQPDQERAQIKAKQQLEQFTDRPNVTAEGAIALLVDDGIATGMTMAVAAIALREQQPREIWIGVPVAPAAMVDRMRQWCDRLIVLATPDPFWSVSRFYQSFPQVEMEEAQQILKKAIQT